MHLSGMHIVYQLNLKCNHSEAGLILSGLKNPEIIRFEGWIV